MARIGNECKPKMIASRLDQPCRPGSPRVATPARGSICVRAIRLSTTGHATGFCGRRNRMPSIASPDHGPARPGASAPAYLVRDNDRAYGHVFTSRVRAMGIRDRPISPGSPWQNGCAERLIGTLRRECLDQVLFGGAHLRRILSAYAAYYNQARTHLALQKDAPSHRAVQRSGAIVAIPILAGLHHQYVRI